jgi:uncharacterized protein DUF6516
MKAELLVRRRVATHADAFVETVIWRVPQAVSGSAHGFKYRLAYIVDDVCVLRYDNEAGKGDHRHWNGRQTTYVFVDMEKLLADFKRDIARWNRENSRS